MSIFIYLAVALIIFYIWIKMIERKRTSKIIEIKTGKPIRYFTILESFVITLQRFIYGRDMFEIVTKNGEKKGELYGLFFMSKLIITCTNPNELRNILSMKNFTKPNEMSVMGKLFKKYLMDSLLMLNDEPWIKQRKAINSAMSYSKIKEFIPIFSKMANTLVKKIKEKKGEKIDMNEQFTLLTFDVIGKAGFGYDFDSLIGSQNKELGYMKTILGNLFNLPSVLFKSLYDNLPLKNNKLVNETCVLVDKWIHDIIVERREKNNKSESDNKHKDLLDLILEAEKEENLNLTSKELHNNIFLFFFAGHDTSSSALTSVLYFLAKFPEYIKKGREEIASVLDGESLTFEDLQNFPLCNAIVKETLRLIPPVGAVTGRLAEVDVELCGYHIPKGTLVSCPTFLAHLDSKYWEDPLKFYPERFLDNKSKEAQKNAYFPFGYGPRRCPGDKFATSEILVTFIIILKNFKGWELDKNWSLVFDSLSITTKFKNGLPLKFFEN